jgi:uncharacterized protein (DUF1501 family)
MPAGVEVSHLQDRTALRKQFDKLQRDRDTGHQMAATDEFAEKALDMIVSPKVRDAFDVSKEPEKLRDAYGRISVGEKALLARRLVEAGSTFVLVSGRWGYFDHHGDKVPPWGGIQKGLTPILPTIDRALTTLIEDLDARGLLESTLVLMLGEFGRSPKMTEDAGRNHWTPVMSMLAAGGAGAHGCVVGSTDTQGGTIKSRKVTPEDLAATVFRHLDIPLDSQWMNPQGRPVPIVANTGAPIPELV